ncbi:MAG: hypothetical protein GY913_24055 [Proteobacteria bacterium]|nr:hypothetical protein [Pseudomonadota bacterium]MCP4919988.1 hypothetical protein [Pseudomonadota bacterium]
MVGWGAALAVAALGAGFGTVVVGYSMASRRLAAACTATWQALREDPDVSDVNVTVTGTSCTFSTPYGAGRVDPGIHKATLRVAWRKDAARFTYTAGRIVCERPLLAVDLLPDSQRKRITDRRPRHVKLGPVVELEVDQLEPGDAQLLMALARGQPRLWPEAHEQLDLRAELHLERYAGTVDGMPMVIEIGTPCSLELQHPLGDSFRIEHVETGSEWGRKSVENPVASMTLACYGHTHECDAILADHADDLLRWIHGHPGSVLADDGITIVLPGLPDDDELLVLAHELAALLRRLER